MSFSISTAEAEILRVRGVHLAESAPPLKTIYVDKHETPLRSFISFIYLTLLIKWHKPILNILPNYYYFIFLGTFLFKLFF